MLHRRVILRNGNVIDVGSGEVGKADVIIGGDTIVDVQSHSESTPETSESVRWRDYSTQHWWQCIRTATAATGGIRCANASCDISRSSH